jgi:hypothetical protein
MKSELNIVEVSGGVAEVTQGDALIIDWDNSMDYDTAASIIIELLGSDLDGPVQMSYIGKIVVEFEKFAGKAR